MSRNNVFKLSGNMALGSAGSIHTYSTTQLENIKSSLRLLKARQNQKKSQQNIPYQNSNAYNNGVYSANIPVRNQMRKPSIKDNGYYESNAKNHIPISYNDNQTTQLNKNDRGSKMQTYNQEKDFPVRSRNQNYSHKLKNQYNYNNNFNNQPINKDLNRNQPKTFAYNQSDKNQFALQKNTYKKNQEEFDQRNQQQNYNKQNYKKPPANISSKNYSNQNANRLEQIPIKMANKQKKVQVVQYDPSDLVTCSAGCGRKFNPDSIDKHQAICVKVFQKKRKEFNAQQHRILDNQHKKLVKNMEYEQKKSNNTNKNKKIPKWKADSLAFRAGLKANKNGQISAQDQKILDQAKNIGLIKCPHCGRTFNETAGPKHINFCEQQSKKNSLKKK